MGIEYLHIETYKGLVDKKLEGLGDVNILVGDNNTCKTTFLEAISLSMSIDKFNAVVKVILSKINRIGFGSEEFLETLFQLFNANEENKKIIINTNDKNFNLIGFESVNTHNIKIFNGKLNDKKYIIDPMEKELPLIDNTVYENADKEKTVEFIHAINNNNEILLQANLSDSMLLNKEDVLSLISSFDENIIDMMYVAGKYSNKAVLKLRHKTNGWLNLSSYGDGIKKVVLIVSTIVSANKCGILLIDEIETSLHVSALDNVYLWLIKVCKERNIQLFITTHSLEALTTLTEIGVEDDDIDLVVYKLENYKNDIIIRKIEEHRAMDILEDGGDLR